MAHQPHLCQARGCSERIPPKLLFCSPHWYALPAVLRTTIYKTYHPGQEEGRAPSQEWIDAARQAINYLAKKEGKPPVPDNEDIIKTLQKILSKP